MSDTSVDIQSVVEREAAQWGKGFDELCQSYRDLLGEDVEYLCQQDMPIVHGAEAALELIQGFHDGFGVRAIEVEWLKVAQVGNDVWNERNDYMIGDDGERFLTIPIAGFFSFDDDGKLVRWHDYWDQRNLYALLD